jgi:hypothetical protein
MKTFKEIREACWKGYKQVGTKKKGDRQVPNCVPEEAEVWDKPNPVKNSSKLSPADKARAKARAKAAGRAYPNMVDNIWAARNEAAVMESGGDKIFKNANGHVEKYSEHSYAVYRNGQKQTFYTTLDAAKAALAEENTATDRFKKYIRPVTKTTPKIERSTEPAGRTSDHTEWKVTGPTGEIRRFKSKKEAHAHYNSFSEAAPAWTRKEGKSPSGGLNAKGIASYRRANPGSKLSMAVTTPPSKLDPDGKAAGRRRSFCARMGGSKGPMKDEKGRPTRKALALRKWNC